MRLRTALTFLIPLPLLAVCGAGPSIWTHQSGQDIHVLTYYWHGPDKPDVRRDLMEKAAHGLCPQGWEHAAEPEENRDRLHDATRWYIRCWAKWPVAPRR